MGVLYDAPMDNAGGDGGNSVESPDEDEAAAVIPFVCGAAASATEVEEWDEQEDAGRQDVEGGHTPWLRAGAYAWAVSGSSQVNLHRAIGKAFGTRCSCLADVILSHIAALALKISAPL
jgi:hypothetical protein